MKTGESNANIEIMKDSDWDDILRLEEGKHKRVVLVGMRVMVVTNPILSLQQT